MLLVRATVGITLDGAVMHGKL